MARHTLRPTLPLSSHLRPTYSVAGYIVLYPLVRASVHAYRNDVGDVFKKLHELSANDDDDDITR